MTPADPRPATNWMAAASFRVERIRDSSPSTSRYLTSSRFASSGTSGPVARRHHSHVLRRRAVGAAAWGERARTDGLCRLIHRLAHCRPGDVPHETEELVQCGKHPGNLGARRRFGHFCRLSAVRGWGGGPPGRGGGDLFVAQSQGQKEGLGGRLGRGHFLHSIIVCATDIELIESSRRRTPSRPAPSPPPGPSLDRQHPTPHQARPPPPPARAAAPP